MEKIAQLFEVPVERLLDDYNLFLRNGQGKQIKAIRMKLGLTQREYADIAIDPEISRLQWKLAEGKAPADIHFCESVEAAIVLAEAGFGLAILPEVMLPANHQLKTVALADSPRLSFGIYYKPFPGDALLKHFIQIAKHCFQSSCKEVQAAHQQAAEVPYNPV